MTKITLPPLHPHPEPMVMQWSPLERAAIRARDIEVARVVLEVVAKVCESRQTPGTGSVAILNGAAEEIRALEISHD